MGNSEKFSIFAFISGCLMVLFISIYSDRSSDFYYDIVNTGESLCDKFGGWKQADLKGNYVCKNGVEVKDGK